MFLSVGINPGDTGSPELIQTADVVHHLVEPIFIHQKYVLMRED
jgi:hypothetical protein